MPGPLETPRVDSSRASNRLRRSLALAVLAFSVPLIASDYLTEGNDPGRTGWMKDEKVFTPAKSPLLQS